ncbi:hypothetical protein POSPLADRAFT_1044325 [Postia placenta MAD-698-R-SB12]|uniref:RBR-type E3 ubiquitin transferase n=1 Tax=Postia placenta MAD-698-R-SB12 TaxID=670580 RepID=A0A1X6N8F1_9APHY|nr:hypothetical protein POSPLADRAFT_1044325 [Postia placenta MAD-698-R-SB12]OSX64891.1 hypothetical protein POSPLADRAFT_1044325 [Postia placenta MAD-698-R-SB12]
MTKDKGKEKTPSIEYESLTSTRLQELVDEDIRNVASVLGLESPIGSILLRYFRWNKDLLLERFMDDPTTVLRNVGEPEHITSESSGEPNGRPNKRARFDTPSDFVCAICCDDQPESIFKLRCAHAFCEPCWQIYITSKIKDEGQCLFNCMQDECKTIVDDPSVQKLVDTSAYDRFVRLLLVIVTFSHEPFASRYRELVTQSYVSAHPEMRFCPHPSCNETVSCPSGKGSVLLTEVPTVRCGHGHVFCFGCGLDSNHRPLICKLTTVWLKSAREDAGTAQWIKANTRSCPKCENSIEKAGGCNRILCRHCNFQFCWLCRKNWDIHGYNNEICNTWKEPEPDEIKTEAKQNLEKWLFYFDRFNNHELSARLDQELCERTEEKMVNVQENSNLSWIEAKFVQNAVDELTACRLTLKWSYAMAYFLAAGNQKEMFEDIQADLEKAVEALSQLLEESIEESTIKTLRQRMMDKTVYVQGRHEILLRDTAEGLAEGRWEWNVLLE